MALHNITGKTKLLGVIGYPVEHSLSPVMHNAAIQAIASEFPLDMPLNIIYVPFAVAPEDLETAIAGLWSIGVKGLNLTIPHKQAVIPLLAEVSPVAQAVGAVNTLYRTEQGWGGTNTDVTGFLAPLRSLPQNWAQSTVVVLGNGGAARAVVAGCAELGCGAIQVVGRDGDRLHQFLKSWADHPVNNRLSVHLWQELPNLLPTTTLLVNTTPIGMHPKADASPLTEAALGSLPTRAIAYDLIYTPCPTKFLHLAQTQGAIAIDGLEMLVQQGAAALELWLQRSVPVEVMRQALETHLQFSPNQRQL